MKIVFFFIVNYLKVSKNYQIIFVNIDVQKSRFHVYSYSGKDIQISYKETHSHNSDEEIKCNLSSERRGLPFCLGDANKW